MQREHASTVAEGTKSVFGDNKRITKKARGTKIETECNDNRLNKLYGRQKASNHFCHLLPSELICNAPWFSMIELLFLFGGPFELDLTNGRSETKTCLAVWYSCSIAVPKFSSRVVVLANIASCCFNAMHHSVMVSSSIHRRNKADLR